MSIKILGTGCKKCQTLEANVRALVEKHQIDAVVEKVTDINEMVNYGIMMTPGLVVNEKVVSYGVVPKESQLLTWLKG
ncbi:MAG: TM0996/MTH895 family glutaredoxin-like protein [Ignavibacteriaceae bacterium]|nr:TM0996/MTH895 family glutaredoxin-like protein [Ignavibacteriaceae bacterium]